MTATMTGEPSLDAIDRIALLLPFFDARRLGACPYCDCVTAWLNASEFGQHVFACIRIMQGIETEASRARKAAKT